MEQCCELPFGYVYTPMAPCASENTSVVDCKSEALPPVLCLSCLTYINKFAKLDPTKNVWECPLCGSEENVMDPSLIQQGGLLSSVLSTPIVEYRQQIHTSQLTDDGTNKPCRNYILVLDSNLNSEEAHAVAIAVQTVCTPKEGDDSDVQIGLIVFDKSIAMYQLGLSGMASADLCTIKQANSDEHLANRRSQILKRPYLATVRPGNEDDMSYLWRCISAVYGTTLSGDSGDVQSSPEEAPQPMSRLDKLKQRKEARQRQEAQASGKIKASSTPNESPWVRAKSKAASAHPYRCTGEALQCAIDLATISQTKTFGRSQILLFTNGCPNVGDGSVVAPDYGGNSRRALNSSSHRQKPDVIQQERLSSAVQYFEKLAEVAQEHEVGVDVFCTGTKQCYNYWLASLLGAIFCKPARSLCTQRMHQVPTNWACPSSKRWSSPPVGMLSPMNRLPRHTCDTTWISS